MDAFFNRADAILKTDVRYLARGGFWLALGRTIGVGAGLLLAIAFANLLPKDVFGTYQFILSIAAIASAFTLTGMNTAIVRAVARGYEGTLRAGTLKKLQWSIGVLVASSLIAGYYFFNNNLELAISLLVVGAFSPFLESYKLYNAFLIGKKDFRANTLFNTLRQPLPLVALTTALFFTSEVILIVLTYFASHTVSVVLLYLWAKRKYKPNEKVDAQAIDYSKHLSLMQIVNRVAGNIDKILLFHFLGAAQLAIYIFAVNIPKQFQSLISSSYPLLLPKLSNRSMQELRVTLPRKAFIFFLFLLVPTATYIFLSPVIYKIFFPQYLDSVLFSQVFALSFLFVPAILFENALHAQLKKKALYAITATVPTTRIVLSLILVPLFGIWGVLATMFVAQAMNLGLLLYLFRKL